MSERPFMQLYVSDYLGDTRHLSCEQHGAYLLLLMTMWNAGGRLSNDDAKLARIVGLSLKKWRGIQDDVLAFFDMSEGVVTHNRLTKEIEKSERKSQSRASAGAMGGAAKALKNKHTSIANATVLPQHLPDTITREEKEEPTGSSKKRGSRLPNDWQPDIAFAVSIGLSQAQALNEAQKFREWWPAQPGQKGVKLDWALTWKTWCRKTIERLPHQRATAPPRKSAFDALDEIARLKGWTDESDGLPGNHENAERLSAVGGGPAGTVVDLRRGHDWHRGSGDH